MRATSSESEMHTGAMTYEQGIDLFVNEAYQTRANALLRAAMLRDLHQKAS